MIIIWLYDGWWGEVASSGDRLFVSIICTKYFEADWGGDVNICGTTTNLKRTTRKERSTQPEGGLMSIYSARSTHHLMGCARCHRWRLPLSAGKFLNHRNQRELMSYWHDRSEQPHSGRSFGPNQASAWFPPLVQQLPVPQNFPRDVLLKTFLSLFLEARLSIELRRSLVCGFRNSWNCSCWRAPPSPQRLAPLPQSLSPTKGQDENQCGINQVYCNIDEKLWWCCQCNSGEHI